MPEPSRRTAGPTPQAPADTTHPPAPTRARPGPRPSHHTPQPPCREADLGHGAARTASADADSGPATPRPATPPVLHALHPRHVLRAFHRAAHRLHAATPASRDRAVDALRAFAILGVVLGHWLVTALVAADGGLHTTSPLQHMPRLAPVSWLFQTLAVFFLVGGHVAAHSRATARARGDSYALWLRARLTRLLRPVAALLALWAVAATALLLTGASLPTVHALLTLALSPLWFLLVFAALTAATPLVARLNPLWPLVVVLHVDLFRFGLHQGSSWLGWVNLGAGWLVPYTLGAAWARGELRSRLSGWALLLGGTAATAALVTWAGYPASMVGVPGGTISNLNPPTLAAVTFGLAQCGLALLLRDRLRRATARPAVWAAVAVVNLSAMTIYLWHQTAMMATTATGLRAGRLPGLHTPPGSLTWVAYRIAWLPVFALVLAVCWAAFRHHEQVRRPATASPAPCTAIAPAARPAPPPPPDPSPAPPAPPPRTGVRRPGPGHTRST